MCIYTLKKQKILKKAKIFSMEVRDQLQICMHFKKYDVVDIANDV